MILTYIAIIWANATALPLIARTLLGDTFRFGYLYEIAGYPIYLGELLLALGALTLAAMVCTFRKTAARIQIIMAILLFLGVVICFACASGVPCREGFRSGLCTGEKFRARGVCDLCTGALGVRGL